MKLTTNAFTEKTSVLSSLYVSGADRPVLLIIVERFKIR